MKGACGSTARTEMYVPPIGAAVRVWTSPRDLYRMHLAPQAYRPDVAVESIVIADSGRGPAVADQDWPPFKPRYRPPSTMAYRREESPGSTPMRLAAPGKPGWALVQLVPASPDL